MRIKNAKGVTGFLLLDFEGNYFFRVYKPNGFTDYRIKHSDLEVKILNESAFYESDEEHTLDHDPRTLGLMDDGV